MDSEVLTHNCNHFSNKVSKFLLNQNIPDHVLLQPEIAMNTITARALRPLLNRWLGGFEKEAGGEEGSSTAADVGQNLWKEVQLGAIVEYQPYLGALPVVGEVVELMADTCTIRSFERNEANLRTPVNNIEYFPPNFEGLVLGCIDADFCK